MLPEEVEVDFELDDDDEDDDDDCELDTEPEEDLFDEKLPVLLFVRGVVISAAG
jgi:hypothetical protein